MRYRYMNTQGIHMQKDSAYQAVCSAVGDYFEVHPHQVQPHHELRRDWGLEQVELELLVTQIEEMVGVELAETITLPEITTVGQLVRAVRSQLRRANRAQPLREVG